MLPDFEAVPDPHISLHLQPCLYGVQRPIPHPRLGGVVVGGEAGLAQRSVRGQAWVGEDLQSTKAASQTWSLGPASLCSRSPSKPAARRWRKWLEADRRRWLDMASVHPKHRKPPPHPPPPPPCPEGVLLGPRNKGCFQREHEMRKE